MLAKHGFSQFITSALYNCSARSRRVRAFSGDLTRSLRSDCIIILFTIHFWAFPLSKLKSNFSLPNLANSNFSKSHFPVVRAVSRGISLKRRGLDHYSPFTAIGVYSMKADITLSESFPVVIRGTFPIFWRIDRLFGLLFFRGRGEGDQARILQSASDNRLS